MRKLVHIDLENFRLVQSASLSLADKGLVFVRGENLDVPNATSNMAGKSTLIHALTWCLYGLDASGTPLYRDVVRNGATQARVRLAFDDGTEVVRTRFVNGSPAVILDFRTQRREVSGVPEEVQREIDAAFGPAALFLATHVYSFDEGGTEFASASDSAKKRLLDLLLDNADLDRAYENAKAKRDAIQKRLHKLTLKTERLEERIAVEASHLERHVQDVAKAQQEQEHLRSVYRGAQKLLDECTPAAVTALQALQEAIAKRDTVRRVVEGKIQVAQNTEASAATLAKLATERWAAAKKAVPDGMSGASLECPTCGERVSIEKYARHKQALLYAADEAQKKHYRTVDEVQKIVTKERARQQEAEQRVIDARKVVEACKTRLDQAERERIRAEAALNAATTAVQNAAQTMKTLRSTLNTLKRKRSIFAAHQRKQETRLKRVRFWVEGFGPGGLRAYRMEQVIPALNQIAKVYSDALFGDGSRVSYSTQKEKKSGGYSERFNIALLDADGTPQTVASAGQAQRRNVIHTLSISTLAEQLGKRTLDLIVFDEAFHTLDMAGVTAVLGVLRSFAAGSILVVEHNDEFAACCDAELVARRENGRTDYGFVEALEGLGTGGGTTAVRKAGAPRERLFKIRHRRKGI